MIEMMAGWAFLKVELFSNLLWKNVRKLNSFDTTNVKLWRDLHEHEVEQNSEFLEAVNDCIDIPGLSTIKQGPENATCKTNANPAEECKDAFFNQNYCSNNSNVEDENTSTDILKVIAKRLDTLIVTTLKGNSSISQESDQDCDIKQMKADVQQAIMEKCIEFREMIRQRASFSETELINNITIIYEEMVNIISHACNVKKEGLEGKVRKKNVDSKQIKETKSDNKPIKIKKKESSTLFEETKEKITDNESVCKENDEALTFGKESEEEDQVISNSCSQAESLEDHHMADPEDELDQLHLFRNRQCSVSTLTMESNIGNVFLLAAKKVSTLLEDHLNHYRKQVIDMASSESLKPIDIIDVDVMHKSQAATRTIRIPILLSDDINCIIHKLQHKWLRYLWAVGIPLYEDSCSDSVDAENVLANEGDRDQAKDSDEILLPLFDIAPYLSCENDIQSESPSTWISSIDKRFYNSLIGSDKRKKTKLQQEGSASPINTNPGYLSMDIAGSQLRLKIPARKKATKICLLSPKGYREFETEPYHLAADMAGGDVSMEEPKEKDIRRCLWETEGNDGDHGASVLWGSFNPAESESSKPVFPTSTWDNEDVQKGFLTSFDLFGSPKYFRSPKEHFKFKDKSGKSPAQVKLSESIKALRRLQKEFADRDLKSEGSINQTKENNICGAECLQNRSSDDIPSLLHRYVVPIQLDKPVKQPSPPLSMSQPTEDATVTSKDKDEEIQYSDVPEQEYYCLENEDLWDEPANADFDFGSQEEFSYDDHFYYDPENETEEEMPECDEMLLNGAGDSGYANAYNQWSDHDNIDEIPTIESEVDQRIPIASVSDQSANNHVGKPTTTVQSSSAVPKSGENWSQSINRPTMAVYPQHNNWFYQGVTTNGNQAKERNVYQQPPPAPVNRNFEAPQLPALLQPTNSLLGYNQLRINQPVQQPLPYGFVQGSNVPQQLQAYPYSYFPLPPPYVPSQMYGQPQYPVPLAQNQPAAEYSGVVYPPNLQNMNYLRSQRQMLPQMPAVPPPRHFGNPVQGIAQQPTIFNPFRQ